MCLKVLDLGCGAGRDGYILSKLVGENGSVHGIDMTENQVNVAKKYIDEQTKRFGYKKPNVRFIHDYLESTGNHFSEESLDLITSNCVINLVEDKENLIKQAYQILKFGGELYFSDIYADRRVPKNIKKDSVLYGECLGGALYWKDYQRIAKKVGFLDLRVVSKRVVDITDDKIKKLVGNITFRSITYRLWKLKGIEDACEDYGHIAVYKGGIPESPFEFVLDDSHLFEKNRPEKLCGATALMLSQTMLKYYFQVIGSFNEHFGKFKDCGAADTGAKNEGSNTGSYC